MSPLARLEWLRVIAGTPGLLGPPLGLAVALTKFINADTSDARPSVATLARELQLSERTVQKAARALESAGLVRVEHPAGRKCCTYSPAFPVQPDRVQPRPAGLGSTTSNPVPSGRQPRPIRLPTPSSRSPEQGLNKNEQGKRRGTPIGVTTNGGQADPHADTLATLRQMRCPMTSKGESILGEWHDLLDAHPAACVFAAARGLECRDRWPSRVRAVLEAPAPMRTLVPIITETIPTLEPKP